MSVLNVSNETLNFSGIENYNTINVGVNGTLNVNASTFFGNNCTISSNGVLNILGAGLLNLLFYNDTTFVYGNNFIQFIGAKTEKIQKKSHIVRHEIIARSEIVQWMGYASPVFTVEGFFTGSDCIVQRTALESVWQNVVTGSLYLSVDMAQTSPYNVYLESVSPSLKGGYFESYLGQGFLPYKLQFAVIL